MPEFCEIIKKILFITPHNAFNNLDEFFIQKKVFISNLILKCVNPLSRSCISHLLLRFITIAIYYNEIELEITDEKGSKIIEFLNYFIEIIPELVAKSTLTYFQYFEVKFFDIYK